MRLICLNVERSNHLQRFLPFLQSWSADVVCLQELVETDIAAISEAARLRHCHFVPMARHKAGDAPFGVGIFARHAFQTADTIVYAGGGSGTNAMDRSTPESRLATMRYAAARVVLASDEFSAAIATTHFPWTEGGKPSDFQNEAAQSLIDRLSRDEMVLCGDFNAPRGGPIFDQFSRQWTDCIPAGITSSIDPHLHRAGALELMVDGVFATPRVHVGDVRLHAGVSDHKGITATIRDTG